MFSSLTKWLRGQDKMASRAASGPRVIVWRHLVHRHIIFLWLKTGTLQNNEH